MDNTKLLATIKNIWVHEGPTGYYKGISAPLISVPFINSCIFASYEVSKKLLQLYTGLVYEGPGLIGAINDRLAQAVRAAGARNIRELTGRKADEWAAMPIA